MGKLMGELSGYHAFMAYTNSQLYKNLPANASLYEANDLIIDFYRNMISCQGPKAIGENNFSLEKFNLIIPYKNTLITEQYYLKINLGEPILTEGKTLFTRLKKMSWDLANAAYSHNVFISGGGCLSYEQRSSEIIDPIS